MNTTSPISVRSGASARIASAPHAAHALDTTTEGEGPARDAEAPTPDARSFGTLDDPRSLPDAERLRRFGEAIDLVGRTAKARVGDEDVAYVKRVDRFSRTMEVVGRGLLHFSFEPIGFLLGTAALFLHKQLQATEIGHTALHGAYDGLPGAEKYQSKSFYWDVPIDEESWRAGHNVKHHGNTNVVGRDPDVHFGLIRLSEHVPYAKAQALQLPFALGVLFPTFGFFMNWHFTGLHDVFFDNGLPSRFDVLPDRSRKSVALAFKRALRKYVPYYFETYVAWPALAGPLFWKVALGNFLAETARDIYSAATIFCGHVGEETASYPMGTRPSSRGHFYAMQVESTNNFVVSRPVSQLCGGLDLQIEHHLFPTLPPERLREIAPEVRAICHRYGVTYREASWGKTLLGALRHIRKLAREGGAREVLRAAV